MIKMKPVWVSNTSGGIPPIESNSALYQTYKGSFIVDKDLGEDWCLSDVYPVTAYQTNRTKVAKFERVLCDRCRGSGVHDADAFEELSRLHQLCIYHKSCSYCHGRGHTWERIK